MDYIKGYPYKEQDQQDVEEHLCHFAFFPLNQVFALLEEVASRVHVVECEGGTLLEVFELAQDVLILDIIVLVDLLQLLVRIFQ